MKEHGTKIDWNSPDWAFMEEKFRATKDYRYVVLALAKWPNDPPLWAADACGDLAAQVEIAHQPLLGQGRRGAALAADEKHLDAMADLLIADVKTLDAYDTEKIRKAAAKIAEDVGSGVRGKRSVRRRLRRKWLEEIVEIPGSGGELFHPRIERAILRECPGFRERCYRGPLRSA